ncbi:MAG TPA: FHA domain-containing protein [Actinomycetota bacterium]|nr:FHA domain-containing protein [Actinomycetota bacterium]
MDQLSLEIVEGTDAGRRVAVVSPLTVGRAADADLALADELVSRWHARVSKRGAGAVVEDLGSRNGTFVNGNQIHGPTRLVPGDQLQVGVTLVELRSATQIAERPSAVQPVPPPLAVPERTPDYLPAGSGADPARPPVDGGSGGLKPSPPVDGGTPRHELDSLLDSRTKGKARTAPLALFVLVALVVIIYLATAR